MAKKQKEKKDAPPLKSVNLAKLFPRPEDGRKEDIPSWYDYDKKLPAGDFFEVTFSPVERWKIGLRGFEIHGLDRSKTIGRNSGQEISRIECIAMIKTLLKPGDIELEDVSCFISERKAAKQEKAPAIVEPAG